jgi:Ca2+-binding EF-hand superfamily protein
MRKRKSHNPNSNLAAIRLKESKFLNYEFNSLVNSQLIIESFNIFDEDRTADLDRKEFRKLMYALGSDLDDREINDLYNIVDVDKSGTIDLSEFNSMMLTHNFNKNTPINYILEQCFDLFDKDNDGFIDKNDFQIVGEEFEDLTKHEEIDILFKIIKEFAMMEGIFDHLEDPRISKEEFINMLIKMQFVTEKKRKNSLQNINKVENNSDINNAEI